LAHAYTPGLKVAARTTVRKRRILPLEGEVLVRPGQRVEAATPVAEAALPGPVYPVNVVNRLGVRPEDIRGYMLKQEGDSVEEGEPIAETRPWIKWLRTVCRAPAAGTVESISEVTGQVMLRGPAQKVTVTAYVDGEVVEVIPREGALVQTQAALVQGIFGVGGECNGTLKVLAASPEAVVGPGDLDSGCQKCIIVAGSLASASLVESAREHGVAAVVAGGMPAEDLRQVLGYDIGVAVTGSERIGLSLVLTEGFGRIPMARTTFELLAGLDGRRASACGATQIRAGVVRPEVLVALDGAADAEAEGGPEADGLRPGDRVRIIREPYFGVIGQVEELVSDLLQIETEARVRALRVRTSDARILTVPRANVEIIKA